MRTNIVHIGAGEWTYEIRAIVAIAEKMKELGIKVNMENIGDPVTKGEQIPLWIKEIVADLVMQDYTYGYCDTRGLRSTREFLANLTNQRGHAQVRPDDIIFFNGLGDAIQKTYGLLRREARVINPSPSYSTHSSGEAAHAGTSPVSYRLDPDNNWYPDLDDLRLSVKYNPAIAAILIINPDNPTGAVYPERILREMIQIARDYDLFIIADEIYQNIVYNGEATKPISDLVGDDVPAISMKGISKEIPWPGARCGWMEFYNADKDPMFRRYVDSILNSKMVEVCSTTLPQAAIPSIMSHPEYPKYLQERRDRYERYSNIAYDILHRIPGIKVNRTNGAFYMSVAFEHRRLTYNQSLPIENPEVRQLVEGLVAEDNIELDKRFIYYLLGATGICVVPLSSFHTHERGFRITFLEQDEEEFSRMITLLGARISDYLVS